MMSCYGLHRFTNQRQKKSQKIIKCIVLSLFQLPKSFMLLCFVAIGQLTNSVFPKQHVEEKTMS